MSAAPGIADRLLALEAAVAELRALVLGVGQPAPTPEPAAVKGEPSDLEQLAQRLGNSRLAAVLARAGLGTVADVAAASDEQLRAIDGVSEKALRLVRERVASSATA